MKRIGLTGGIACGKSTVAGLIRGMGVPVLDADQVARDVVAPGSAALREIAERFGPAVIDEDGGLRRKLLGGIVVSDSGARADLEAITHPRIFAAIERWLAAQDAAGHAHAVVEAALMVETGSYTAYDAMLVVACNPDVQMARLLNRDPIDAVQARRWLDAQLPVSDKVGLADAVIWNDGPPTELPELVQSAWAQLNAR